MNNQHSIEYTDFDWNHEFFSSSSSSSQLQQRHSKFHSRFKSETFVYDYHKQQQHQQQHQQLFLSPPPFQSESQFDLYEQDLLSNDHHEIQFQYDITLDAPTAISKTNQNECITYLNRGQYYDLNFRSVNNNQSTLTSTVTISFHESAHRELSKNYWTYWHSQQDNQQRAVDIDIKKTIGAFNIKLISFNRITFNWNNRARISICFHCLSTDFSRIKGVKGIPLRLTVTTTQSYVELPITSFAYKGQFQKKSNYYEYREECYCKIKIFRDKGAERKNKDDKKQVAKRLEKVLASTNGKPENHPLWSILNQKNDTISKLNEIPSSPETQMDDLIPIFESKRQEMLLTFFVWTRNFISNSNPNQIFLDTLTTQHLKSKLAAFLSIHQSKIGEILWRRKESDIFVLVEDSFITEHISNGELVMLDWKINSEGIITLILEF